MVYWILIIFSLSGGVVYEPLGYGAANETRCKALAAAIEVQTPHRVRASCVGSLIATSK